MMTTFLRVPLCASAPIRGRLAANQLTSASVAPPAASAWRPSPMSRSTMAPLRPRERSRPSLIVPKVSVNEARSGPSHAPVEASNRKARRAQRPWHRGRECRKMGRRVRNRASKRIGCLEPGAQQCVNGNELAAREQGVHVGVRADTVSDGERALRTRVIRARCGAFHDSHFQAACLERAGYYPSVAAIVAASGRDDCAVTEVGRAPHGNFRSGGGAGALHECPRGDSGRNCRIVGRGCSVRVAHEHARHVQDAPTGELGSLGFSDELCAPGIIALRTPGRNRRHRRIPRGCRSPGS